MYTTDAKVALAVIRRLVECLEFDACDGRFGLEGIVEDVLVWGINYTANKISEEKVIRERRSKFSLADYEDGDK